MPNFDPPSEPPDGTPTCRLCDQPMQYEYRRWYCDNAQCPYPPEGEIPLTVKSKKRKGRSPLYTRPLERKDFRLRKKDPNDPASASDFDYLQSATGNASHTIRLWIDKHKAEHQTNP